MPPKPQIKPKQPARRRGAAAAEAAEASASTETPAAPPPEAPTAPIAPVAPVNLGEGSSGAPVQEPVLPPAGRLDGLKKPIATTGLRGRGALKFQPKAVARRPKEEREQLERALATSELAAVGETAAAPKPFGRGRGSGFPRGEGRGRGRGRGGDRPPPRRNDEPATASGPFSLGSVISGKTKATIERRGDAGGNRPRQTFGRRVKREGADKEEYEDVGANGGYSSEDSEGPKVEVEFINLISDDEEDEVKDSMIPVRIMRTEHFERQQVVNTEPTAGRKRGKGDLKVKPDPDAPFGDVEVLPDAPPLQQPPRTSRSPEARRKSFSKRRGSSVARGGKPRFRTKEEKEEDEYLTEERLELLRELGMLEPKEEVNFKYDDHGNVDMADYLPAAPNAANELFYFQFPPHLPNLVPLMEAASLDDEIEVKSENITSKKKKEEPQKQYNLTNPAPVPDGQIGYLRIHRSGKMSVQWGTGPDAMVLDVTRGMKTKYPTEVVAMDVDAGEGEDERGNKVGTSWNLGEVKGRMVVSMGMDALM